MVYRESLMKTKSVLVGDESKTTETKEETKEEAKEETSEETLSIF